MKIMRIRATNINTGEIIEGDPQYVADRLGIAKSTLYKAHNQELKIGKQWEAKVINDVSYSPSPIPKDLLDDWIKTTKEIRELLKMRKKVNPVKKKNKNRLRKPQ